MKILISAAIGMTAFCAAGLALAQQIAPVINPAAAIACAPKDMAAAVGCLETHLRPEVKADIAKVTNPDQLLTQEIYVGLWVRTNWGLWSGSPLSQYMLTHKVTQLDAMSNRIVDAYYLKTKGCKYDLNDVGYVVAATNKLGARADPCSVTVAEATLARSQPMGAPRARAAAAGQAGRAAATVATVAADDTED